MNTLHVIKIGGNVIDNEAILHRFLDDLAVLNTAWILVHGGGKLATQLSTRLGVETQMMGGRRITDAETLDIVTMVYGGLINKRIVAALQARGVNALGLTGADGDVIRARKRGQTSTDSIQSVQPDYGFVGDVEIVRADRLRSLLQQGFTPVLAPLTHNGQGQLLNTNADTIAAEIASALAAPTFDSAYDIHLVYCFEKRGVLRSVEDDSSAIPHLKHGEYKHLQASGVIAKGMIPKLDNAFAAVERGVASVRICHSDDVLPAVQGESFGTIITHQ
jgi:acetylglutamate kinase